jgi:integrase
MPKTCPIDSDVRKIYTFAKYLNRRTSIICDMEAEKFLRREEFDKLLQAAKDDREKCILYMLAGVGLRVAEMSSVKVSHIDFDRSYLHIPEANSKGKKARTVALLPPVVEALKAYLMGRVSGWLFPSIAGDHIGSRQIQYILNSIAARAGIERRVHPHLLRHSFAVWSVEHGIDIYNLQKQLGHSSILTTAIYLEAAPSHRRDAYLRSGMLS